MLELPVNARAVLASAQGGVGHDPEFFNKRAYLPGRSETAMRRTRARSFVSAET